MPAFCSPIIPRRPLHAAQRTTLRPPHAIEMSARRTALVSASKLVEALSSPSPPLLFDATWYMPSSNSDADAEFAAAAIPGARRLDIDAAPLADSSSPLPHMLPTAVAPHADAIRALVPTTRPVVVYAQAGFVGAARAWWALRALGHETVSVLDGGLRKVVEAGGIPVAEAGDEYPAFEPALREELVWDRERVVANAGEVTLLDARSLGRFEGTEREPRAGLEGGHVPGSFSLPAGECVDRATGLLKSREELAALLDARGLGGGGRRFATTCGSGVTAAIVALALYELGYEDVPVYDGSWSEYGQPELKLPIAK